MGPSLRSGLTRRVHDHDVRSDVSLQRLGGDEFRVLGRRRLRRRSRQQGHKVGIHRLQRGGVLSSVRRRGVLFCFDLALVADVRSVASRFADVRILGRRLGVRLILQQRQKVVVPRLQRLRVRLTVRRRVRLLQRFGLLDEIWRRFRFDGRTTLRVVRRRVRVRLT